MPKPSLTSNVSKAVAVLLATVIVGACGGSPQARSITVTFVRHAQSEANASGTINTDVPGPGLSPLGKDQAEQVAHQLGHKDYDSIYASTMTRTQQTAAPLAAELGKQAPMSLRDHFRIGSNTKTMTSTVILQLVEEGKLKLNDPIGKFVKEPFDEEARKNMFGQAAKEMRS